MNNPSDSPRTQFCSPRTQFAGHAWDVHQLLKRVDALMYRSKSEGRNRVSLDIES